MSTPLAATYTASRDIMAKLEREQGREGAREGGRGGGSRALTMGTPLVVTYMASGVTYLCIRPLLCRALMPANMHAA